VRADGVSPPELAIVTGLDEVYVLKGCRGEGGRRIHTPSRPVPLWKRPPAATIFDDMDIETRDAITAMGDTILARMDFHFELQQKQFLSMRVDRLERRQRE
jgi:hypothetical protein